MSATRVSVTVSAEDSATIARIVETFSRATAGLALEGLTVLILCGPEDEEPTS